MVSETQNKFFVQTVFQIAAFAAFPARPMIIADMRKEVTHLSLRNDHQSAA